MSEEHTTDDENFSVHRPIWRSKGTYSILCHVLIMKHIWISVNIVLGGAGQEIREQENQKCKERKSRVLSTLLMISPPENAPTWTLSKDYIKGITKTKCIYGKYLTVAMYFP